MTFKKRLSDSSTLQINFDLSLFDFGRAKLSSGIYKGKVDVTAMASIWAPSATIKIWDVNITLEAHVGSVGGKINVGNGKFDVGASYGYGVSLSFDW